MKAVQEPMVPREDFIELYRKLRFWWGMRHIEESAYVLGMHLLAKMIKLDSREVSGTWSEFANEVVMRGDDLIAGPADSHYFLYLGALQQLHSVVGLFSHINQEGIERSKLDAQDHDFVSQHFTKAPDIDTDLIGEETPMLFVLVPWAGYDVDRTWKDYTVGGNVRQLPAWITTKPKG
jgi:hypothetical protein